MTKIGARMKEVGKKLRAVTARYERHFSVLAFLVGFSFDLMLLPRVDSGGTYIVLGAYLLFVSLVLLIREVSTRSFLRADAFYTFAAQFFFGSLISALVVYYSRSASLFANWPLFLLLLFVVAANEWVRNEKRKLAFDLSLLYFIIFMATNFAVPIYLGVLDVRTFALSAIASLLVFVCYLFFFAAFAPRALSGAVRNLTFGVLGIFITLNSLYVLEFIPPIPLSLRVAEVAHSVSRRIDGSYRVVKEPYGLRELFGLAPRVHQDGAPLYFFSAVFAPTAFATSITHEWQYKDPQSGHWGTTHRVTFPITGGREGGYRGYSITNSASVGDWRIRILTDEGVLIGTESFTVVPADEGVVFDIYDR